VSEVTVTAALSAGAHAENAGLDRQRTRIQTPEAAKYLGVHQETIRRWAREGAIPSAKLGNRGGFRFKREDLDRFLEE
jgi:excisionase family DNA binding protein